MTAPITPDERDAMRGRADAATPGPWEAHDGTVGAMTGPRGCGGCSGLVSPRHEPACFWSEVAGAAPADAEFIAAARTAVPRLLDALDTAEKRAEHYRAQRDKWFEEESAEREKAEVERDDALAEVARLREEGARPAPVWDGDTVRAEAIRAVESVPATTTFSWPRAVDVILAVVREHLPVRPDRETIARAFFDAGAKAAAEEFGLDEPVSWDSLKDTDVVRLLAQADAVLDLWSGESRATVQAEVLRETADAVTEIDGRRDDAAARWLRARADRLEGGTTP